MKIRKMLGILLTALLVMTAGLAMAGQGDTAILNLEEDDYTGEYVQNVLQEGNKIYVFVEGSTTKLQVYDPAAGSLEVWDMQEMSDRMQGLRDEETEEPADSEEPRENWQESVQTWFGKDGEVYAVVLRSLYQGQSNRTDGGHVRKLVLSDGKADLEAQDSFTLDWSGMTETAGSWESARYINASAVQGDYLILTVYDNNGNQSLVVYSLATGEMTEHMIQDLNDFTLTEDGRILICQYRWGDVSEQVISAFDPETGSTQELIRFGMDEGSVNGICVRAETNTLYYTRNGEIFAAPDLDLSRAQAVNDAPVSGQTFAGMIADGRILIWNYRSVLLRNTDPALRSAITLRVKPFSWSSSTENAVFNFMNEHSDISVVREDYGDENTLLQSMMNRDGNVDVYLIDLDSSAFGAILERGFAADLSENAVLTEAVEKMYPFVKESLSRDGKLAAVPLEIMGSAIGYNPEVLEKMGMTEEDLPKTWNQFLDFLKELPDRLAGTDFRAFDLYTYREDTVLSVLRMILNQFSMTREGESMNTDEMRNLLEKIQGIDFDALQILTDEEMNSLEEAGAYEAMGGMKQALLTTYSNTALSTYDNSRPLILALREGEEPLLPVSLVVAFINPYSGHMQEAMLFLESLLDQQEVRTRYSLNPDLNEPLRFPNHEEQRAQNEKWLKIARQHVQDAEDDETRDNWTEVVEYYEKSLAEYDETNWMISPDSLAAYRARAQYVRPLTWNFFSQIYAVDEAGQFWDLQASFAKGTTTARELLTFIDKKVQMMRLEGY